MSDPAFGQTFDAEVGEYEPPKSIVQRALEMQAEAPGTFKMMGTTGLRGGNTILRGGWGDKSGLGRIARMRGSTPISSGAVRNNNIFRPRTWTRFGSQEMFFEHPKPPKSMRGTVGKIYSPFEQLAAGGNWLAKQNVFGTAAQEAARTEGGYFSKGFVSQANAAERLAMRGEVSAARQASLGQYFSKAGMRVSQDMLADPLAARTAVYASARGALTSQIGGYMAGLRDPYAVMRVSGMGKSELAEQAFTRGAVKATEHLALGGLTAGGDIGARALAGGFKTAWKTGVADAAKEAGVATLERAAAVKAGGMAASKFGLAAAGLLTGPAAPFVEAALWISTAFDVSKMIGMGISGVGKMAGDAVRSYSGGLNRQGFGVPFKTNELALTSRARGVQAIANSRLNARSVLGSEASGMSSYFG